MPFWVAPFSPLQKQFRKGESCLYFLEEENVIWVGVECCLSALGPQVSEWEQPGERGELDSAIPRLTQRFWDSPPPTTH